MTPEQGEESRRAGGEEEPEDKIVSDDGLTGLPDILRKVLTLGFSGFFLTETAVRKALGNTVPQEWLDFASEQSERTRGEFIERLSFEVARSLENVDLTAVLSQLLEGRTLEINAEIRLGERQPGAKPADIRVGIADRKRNT